MLIWNTVILEGNKFLEKEDLKKLNNSLRILSLSLDRLSFRATFLSKAPLWTFYRYYYM